MGRGTAGEPRSGKSEKRPSRTILPARLYLPGEMALGGKFQATGRRRHLVLYDLPWIEIALDENPPPRRHMATKNELSGLPLDGYWIANGETLNSIAAVTAQWDGRTCPRTSGQ